MTHHHDFSLLLLSALIFAIGCGGGNKSSSFKSLELTPASAILDSTNLTVQFSATAVYQQGMNTDVTNTVTWKSDNPGVATITGSGLVTSINAGKTRISATMQVDTGPTTASAYLLVETGPPTSTPTPRTLSSIAIIPATGSQTLYAPNETAQFLAVGTFNTDPITADVTDQVNWQSSDVDVATINASGLATAVNCPLNTNCVTIITASCTWDSSTSRCDTASTPPPPLIVETSDLAITPSSGAFLPSLTVYPVGQGWSGASAITSTPVGINCAATPASGASGASCTAYFVQGSTVTLTATAASGVVVGFSSNCLPIPSTASCTVTMSGNQTVGVIFNQQ